MKSNYIIFLFLIFIITLTGCEEKDSQRKTSNGLLIYLPHSDTCANCKTSYIVFDENPLDSVPISLSKKIPSKYRVKGGIRVQVVWEPEDFIDRFYIYPQNWCGPKTMFPVVIYDYRSI